MRKKKIDATRYETFEYWNSLLSEHDLSVDSGRDPRTVYVGDGQQLALIHDLEMTKSGRGARKPPAE